MSPDLNYSSIEAALSESLDRLLELTEDFATVADTNAVAEATFKVAFARARLTARVNGTGDRKITEAQADDIATVETEKERTAMEIAKAKFDATRQALLSTRGRIEALRSLMASYRESGG